MNNTKIVVINQMWYQMIGNDESNNFLIEKYFPKIISIPYFVRLRVALSLKMVLSKHKKQICNLLNQSEAYFLNYAILSAYR